MIIRKINENELLEAGRTFNLSFGIASSDERSNEERVEQAKNNPNSRFDIYFKERWASFNDENHMMACVGTIPFNVRFDGNEVLMSGISGVSTKPEFRGQGVMKHIFHTFLRDEYKEGYTFSYLYPFSTQFYQKLGYELGCEMVNYSLKLAALKKTSIKYTAELHEQGSHTKDIKHIYEQFMKDYNMSVIRDDYDFKGFEKSKPVRDKQYTYVLKDVHKNPMAVLSFKKTFQGDKGIMSCDHFYFVHLDGLAALLDFITVYQAYYDSVQFILPVNFRLSDYLKEWVLPYSSRQQQYKGMVRVVSVVKALQQAYFQGNGELSLRVHDPIIEENNNTFHIKFENNRLTNLEVSKEDPDVECTINDFSRLIIGTHAKEELPYVRDLKIYKNEKEVHKVFFKKLNMIYDPF